MLTARVSWYLRVARNGVQGGPPETVCFVAGRVRLMVLRCACVEFLE